MKRTQNFPYKFRELIFIILTHSRVQERRNDDFSLNYFQEKLQTRKKICHHHLIPKIVLKIMSQEKNFLQSLLNSIKCKCYIFIFLLPQERHTHKKVFFKFFYYLPSTGFSCFELAKKGLNDGFGVEPMEMLSISKPDSSPSPHDNDSSS